MNIATFYLKMCSYCLPITRKKYWLPLLGVSVLLAMVFSITHPELILFVVAFNVIVCFGAGVFECVMKARYEDRKIDYHTAVSERYLRYYLIMLTFWSLVAIVTITELDLQTQIIEETINTGIVCFILLSFIALVNMADGVGYSFFLARVSIFDWQLLYDAHKASRDYVHGKTLPTLNPGTHVHTGAEPFRSTDDNAWETGPVPDDCGVMDNYKTILTKRVEEAKHWVGMHIDATFNDVRRDIETWGKEAEWHYYSNMAKRIYVPQRLFQNLRVNLERALIKSISDKDSRVIVDLKSQDFRGLYVYLQSLLDDITEKEDGSEVTPGLLSKMSSWFHPDLLKYFAYKTVKGPFTAYNGVIITDQATICSKAIILKDANFTFTFTDTSGECSVALRDRRSMTDYIYTKVLEAENDVSASIGFPIKSNFEKIKEIVDMGIDNYVDCVLFKKLKDDLIDHLENTTKAYLNSLSFSAWYENTVLIYPHANRYLFDDELNARFVSIVNTRYRGNINALLELDTDGYFELANECVVINQSAQRVSGTVIPAGYKAPVIARLKLVDFTAERYLMENITIMFYQGAFARLLDLAEARETTHTNPINEV